MAHYRDFIKLAHEKNIKVIQDVVMNHVGPLFYYDHNKNGQLDQYPFAGSDSRKHVKDKKYDDWVQPYINEGFYKNSTWYTRPEWNIDIAQPAAKEVIFGNELPTNGILQSLTTYGRKGFTWDPSSLGKSDGEEVTCDFFALRDIWTEADAPFFDELVDEFVTIYHFYINVLGVDGLRIDTVKHVHHHFWDAFTSRLREKLGPEAAKRLILFGEVYDFAPEPVGKYTYRTDYPNNPTPSLDSLLNFPFCGAVRQYLRVTGDNIGKCNKLEQMVNAFYNATPPLRPYFNPTPGADGLIARQKMINFIGNHDGLNRFLVAGVNEENNRLALGLAMTMEGIPCIYYGSEASFRTAGKININSESGRETFCPPSPHGLKKLKIAKEEKSFKTIRSIARHRVNHPALTDGKINVVWNDQKNSSDDDKGIFAFVRYLEKDGVIDKMATVLIVMNSSTSQAVTAAADNDLLNLVSREGTSVVPDNCTLRRLLIEGQDAVKKGSPTLIHVRASNGRPEARIAVNPKTINMYVVNQ